MTKANDIFRSLAAKLQVLYNRYSFLITREDFDKLVISEIEATIDLFANEPDGSFLINMIELYLTNIIKKQLESPETQLDVINRYINHIFIDQSDQSEIEMFNELDNYFKKYKIDVDTSLISLLLTENEAFQAKAYSLLKNNEEDIYFNLEESFKGNKTLAAVIETYITIFGLDQIDDNADAAEYDESDTYLEIAGQYKKVPLLTREEEIMYAKAIHGNDPIKAEEAREKFRQHNQRLIYKMAGKYANWFNYEDLVQEGRLALENAIEGFDFSLGNRFSTYAVPKIKQAILRAIIKKEELIHIAADERQAMFKMGNIRKELTQKYNREPTVDELAKAMRISVKKVREYIYYKTNYQAKSLDSPISHDIESASIKDFIKDDTITSIEKVVMQRDLREKLIQVINTVCGYKEGKDNSEMNTRNREILIKYFGIRTGKEYSQTELGTDYGITSERVRALVNYFLIKMGPIALEMGLQEYLQNPQKGVAYVKGIEERKEQAKKDTKIIKTTITTIKRGLPPVINGLLEPLSAKEQYVTIFSCGLDGNGERTIEELSTQLKTPPRSIRNLKTNSFKKIPPIDFLLSLEYSLNLNRLDYVTTELDKIIKHKIKEDEYFKETENVREENRRNREYYKKARTKKKAQKQALVSS